MGAIKFNTLILIAFRIETNCDGFLNVAGNYWRKSKWVSPNDRATMRGTRGYSSSVFFNFINRL